MPSLTLEHLEKKYGDQVAVSDVSIAVDEGEFVALLGPSGCGKTTILRMVAGLVQPTSGRILVGTRDVTLVPTSQRQIGLVFQSYALFPHMTVFENVAFGLRRQGLKGRELEQRVKSALHSVSLDQYEARYPRQLSGGQQQRVAIARSIAPQPGVLLFDEPLSNLDAALRDEMQFRLKRLQHDLGMTTLFVTHDQTEAMSMSDRVCVLANGIVQQYARPEDIYHRPGTGFVAGFIGRPNRLTGVVETTGQDVCRVRVAPGMVLNAGHAAPGLASGAAVDIVIRQEDLHPSRQPQGEAYPGKVLLRSFVGSRVQYVVALDAGPELIAEVPTNGEFANLTPGDTLHLCPSPDHVYVSPAAGPQT